MEISNACSTAKKSTCTTEKKSQFWTLLNLFVNEKSPSITSTTKSLKEPSRRNTHLFSKLNNEVSCLIYYRQHLAKEGISERASNLILSSRREGTNSNYCLSWNKRASWCDKQKVDPFRYTLKWVLDLLAELFEQGYQYRSMCSHRSVKPAFHEDVDGKIIGQNPQVSSLITGIFNQRPPQPRYTCIWDVQLVLDYSKKHFPDNKKIADRQLILKVTILLALTSASRVGGLHSLHIRFMTRTENKYSFSFNKLSKSWRQGQKPPVVEFCEYSDDKDLCVVTALDKYILRSSEWRKESNQTQLLLGTIRPYKEVVLSTVSGLVKTVLKLAGVDVNIVKGHSTRAAFTSKATVSALSLCETLE